MQMVQHEIPFNAHFIADTGRALPAPFLTPQ